MATVLAQSHRENFLGGAKSQVPICTTSIKKSIAKSGVKGLTNEQDGVREASPKS